jgi:hypothetical protein
MTSLKGSAQHTLVTPVRLTVRPITLALVALLVAAALAVAIALATSGGAGPDQAGPSNSVRVTPSAPIPPSPAERNQPPGLNGPGMRP